MTGRKARIAAAGAALALTSTNALADGQGAAIATAVYYTAAITIVSAFFLINISLKNRSGVDYAILFAALLGLTFTLEGGLAATLQAWAQAPRRAAELCVGFIAAAIGFWSAERALDESQPRPRLRAGLRWAAGGAGLLAALAWAAPVAAMAIVANLLLVAMAIAQFASTSTWRTYSDRPNRVARSIVAGGFAFMLAAAAVIALTGNGPSLRESFLSANLFRYLYAIIALPTMAAIALALIEMRRSRDAALAAALDAARKDAETNAALLELEKNYSRARDVAAQRTRVLSTATHDIRQPIASLRAELDALRDEAAPATIVRIDRILNHLGGLTEEMSRSARADGDISADLEGTTATEDREAPETLPANLLTQTLGRMFAADARSNGVALKTMPSEAAFSAPPTALMRIGANLVSNAIQHAEASRILIGVRRNKDRLDLIVADDGRGVDSPETAFQAGVKGDASSGDGLGLSIVKELAERHGFAVDLQSTPKKATIFTVSAPRQGD